MNAKGPKVKIKKKRINPMQMATIFRLVKKLEPKKVKSVGQIIRCICILNHTISKTKDLPSTQIIIPQRQIKRKNGNFLNIRYFYCYTKPYTLRLF